MANPNPRNQWQPGRSGNPRGTGPGRPRGSVDRATVLRRVPSIRSLAEIERDARAFKGTAAELMEAVMRDPDQELQTRLLCASALLKQPRPENALERLTVAELDVLIAAARAIAVADGPPLLEGSAEPAEAEPTESNERHNRST
jgi:hypothetical protein